MTFISSQRKPISVREYLTRESEAATQHEFVGGLIYARPRERKTHDLLAANLMGVFVTGLRGQHFWPFDSATKIRIRLPTQTRFYYPDGSVVCRPNPDHDSFQDEPAMIAEVLSRRTRRIDDGEKKDAYLTIPSLNVYMLIEQEMALVTVYRRRDLGFVREVYEGLDAVIPLAEIDIELPLAEIFEAVEFVPEPDDAEAG